MLWLLKHEVKVVPGSIDGIGSLYDVLLFLIFLYCVCRVESLFFMSFYSFIFLLFLFFFL